MGSIKIILKWTVISILSLLSLVVFASIIVAVMGINVNLDRFRPAIEAAVSTALDRKVRITGSVRLQPSLRPTLEIRGLQVDNPEGWTDAVFAAVDLARVQMGIPALLKKKIDVGEITCEKVTLNLETNKDGVSNWQFGSGKDRIPEPEKQNTANTDTIGLQAMDKLSLQQINITYRDNSLDAVLTFTLDKLSGTAQQGQPLQLKGMGSFQNKSFNFILNGGALDELRLRRQLYPLTIDGRVAGSPFTAKGKFGKENNNLELDLDSTLSTVDIGGLLKWLKVAEDIDAQTDELSLHLQLRGDSLRKLVTESTMRLTLKGGRYTLHGAGSGDGIPIAIDKGEVSALSGKPVALNLDGAIDTIPINIVIQGMELVNYVAKPQQLPITIMVKAADTSLVFSGKLALPIRSQNIKLSMNLTGENLNSLDELLNIDLPPLGPYSMEAQFTMQKKGYDLTDLRIKIGTSDLTGKMRLDMAGDKPDAAVDLASSLLQLNDFDLGDWSPEGKSALEEERNVAPEAKPGSKPGERREKIASLLSQQALSAADMHFLIQFDKVMSGKDSLGSGRLEVSLQDGRFSIDPLELKLADGTIHTEFSYYPTQHDARIHLLSTINNLDLGILARRLKPESRMGGQLYLDVQLDATAPSLDQLMANGRGHFDFAFIPENLDAGLLDLWAVNLVTSLASKMDEEDASSINCVVTSFDLEDGIMQNRVIFMDTTRMSIEGEATLNFKNRQLKLWAKPHAKKPEYFSLATPLKVSGTFDDFGIGINVIRLTGTVASFITSPVHVPLRRIFSGKIPEDGKEACLQAWDKRNLRE